MTIFNVIFKAFMNRTGLYRVWVPLHEDGRAPVISIWIDPTMTPFQSQVHEEPVMLPGAAEEEISEEIDDSLRSISVVLGGRQMATRTIQ